MKKLLIRADDLGYCEAYNYGLARAVKDGIIRCVGVMANMEWAAHGVELLRGQDVTFTVHANISQGRPITDPGLIPSLVQADGTFKDKELYRSAEADFVVLEEAVREVEAQYLRLAELTGTKPYMVEGHAVPSANFFEAMAIVARKYGVEYMKMEPGGRVRVGNTCLRFSMESGQPDYDPFESLKRAAMQDMADDEAALLVLHPGYVDEYVYRTSYITRQRAQEVAMATDPNTRAWIEANGVRLLTYRDL